MGWGRRAVVQSCALLRCTLDSALMKAREREVEEARRGETRSWHGSGVPERLFWICGPGRWVKVKSLRSQQMSSCLLPKRSSSLVSQRIPYWDTSPRKSSWFGTPSTGTLHPAVSHAGLFCWRFPPLRVGLKMKLSPPAHSWTGKRPAVCCREREVLN